MTALAVCLSVVTTAVQSESHAVQVFTRSHSLSFQCVILLQCTWLLCNLFYN